MSPDKTIRKNDRVMVVRPSRCCDDGVGMGYAFIVQDTAVSDCTCSQCGHYCEQPIALAEFDDPDGGWIEIDRLMKIDPPAELIADEEHEPLELEAA